LDEVLLPAPALVPDPEPVPDPALDVDPRLRTEAADVRAGGGVAECPGHFLLADNAGIGEWRVICLATCTQRLLS